MLEIIEDRITKSGVILNDKEILKYIDEPFFVNKDGLLKKEITLEDVRGILLSYPSLLEEYKYLKELVVRGENLINEKYNHIDYIMRVVEHIEGNKKIDNLYVVNDGVEYATTFVKLNDLYRVSIRYGINRVFDILNDVEVLIKEYDDDVSLNDFMTTLNMELDFLTDKEIDDFFKMKEEKNIK
ncbi:hypothetical protein ACTOJ1_001443 [Shigella flexneri]